AATVALAYWPETEDDDEGTAAVTSTQTLEPVPPTDLRRGMVLVGSRAQATAAWTIDVELHLLYHASELTRDQTTVIYCGSVRAAAKVDWIDGDGLRTGDRSTVRFRFVNHPEWVRPGMTLLAREGRAGKMKCVGSVLREGEEGE
ncbi:Short integuments 2, mitochondrial, partial [Allomyces javanicus]